MPLRFRPEFVAALVACVVVTVALAARRDAFDGAIRTDRLLQGIQVQDVVDLEHETLPRLTITLVE
jgi:hypothetical protein